MKRWIFIAVSVVAAAGLLGALVMLRGSGFRRDVDYVPTPPEVIDKMLELAKVKKVDLVYDLGCGDGRIVVAAAKKFGCRAVGVEVDPMRVKEARELVEKNEVGDLVRIEQADIFSVELGNADVVALFLLPNLNRRLIPHLEKMKPGSRIVSHCWNMPGIKPRTVAKVMTSEPREREIYLWTTPLEAE